MQNDPKSILFDGFEMAFMGMLRKYGQTAPIAVYDYAKCIQILMDRDGMGQDDAIEWLEFNTLGAYIGEYTPVMLLRCNLSEFIEECDDTHNCQEDHDYGDEHPSHEKDIIDEMTTEERHFLDEAIHNFALNFMKYVREVDTSLYNRAKQYAIDYSGNDVITFNDDENKGEKNETGD